MLTPNLLRRLALSESYALSLQRGFPEVRTFGTAVVEKKLKLGWLERISPETSVEHLA